MGARLRRRSRSHSFGCRWFCSCRNHGASDPPRRSGPIAGRSRRSSPCRRTRASRSFFNADCGSEASTGRWRSKRARSFDHAIRGGRTWCGRHPDDAGTRAEPTRSRAAARRFRAVGSPYAGSRTLSDMITRPAIRGSATCWRSQPLRVVFAPSRKPCLVRSSAASLTGGLVGDNR